MLLCASRLLLPLLVLVVVPLLELLPRLLLLIPREIVQLWTMQMTSE